jgi:hypothetical protein
MKTLRHPLLLVGFCCLLALSAQAAPKDLAMSNDAVQQVPADITALADRAAACRHWSSTDITDQSEDALVEKELSTLKCGALADDAATLEHKYAGSEPALKALELVRAQGF